HTHTHTHIHTHTHTYTHINGKNIHTYTHTHTHTYTHINGKNIHTYTWGFSGSGGSCCHRRAFKDTVCHTHKHTHTHTSKIPAGQVLELCWRWSWQIRNSGACVTL